MSLKRPREHSASSEENEKLPTSYTALLETIKNRAPTPVYHYPSSLPFPVIMDDNFPREAYRSRSTDVKTSVHWGQRKLLLSEIQLLCIYCKPDVSYHIVYAGSAPGTHLAFLDDMFSCRHTWELVDPGKFDRDVLASRPNFQLRNEFFTNATAYGINARRLSEVLPALGAVYQYCAVDSVSAEKAALHIELEGIVGTLDVARGTEDIPSMYETPLTLPVGLNLLCEVGQERNKPLLFVSDIRSGSVALPNFEDHVAENMRAQECWTMILNGAFSMLKFRLPYTRKAQGFGGKDAVAQTHLIQQDGTVPYLRGDLLLPIWTRPTSSEGRLVVPQDAFKKNYDVQQVEDQFFFFNARVREEVHFNHIMCRSADHHFDNAAEVHCLETYLYFMRPELKNASVADMRKEIKLTQDLITEHLKITFTDAIRRRDALVLKQAGQGTNGKGSVDGANDFLPVAKEMLAQAQKERKRAIWSANIYEPNNKEPSGLWVTTNVQEPTKKKS